MAIGISPSPVHFYNVATPVYEGPLDLLLQLIERAELDITMLALAQVTDQYLEHLKTLPELSADEVSAFLVIAAKLIQIKSEMLLPHPPLREPGEEDPGEALARQLLQYKRFKEIAKFLANQQSLGLHTYIRLAPMPRVEPRLDLSGLSLTDLVSAASLVFASANYNVLQDSLKSVVVPPRVTIRQKISLISNIFREHRRISFRAMITDKASRLDIVVTFLAMLELVKLHLVKVRQETLFGDIELEPTEAWQADGEIELEFGE